MKLLKQTIIGVIVCCGLYCSQTDEYVSTNQKSSSCGGFKNLSKQASRSYTQDSLDYCEAEKIRWSYNSSMHILKLFHTRQMENCAAELCMYVKNENSVYTIEERDKSNETADCMCYFDTYSEIENVEDSIISISYNNQNYLLKLTDGEGILEITSDTYWPCLK